MKPRGARLRYFDPDYFENLYRRDPDPWKFASSDYEREKYAATIVALPHRRFTRCFEVGCSIGVLTRQLAERCDTVLGVDVSETALRQARERCADLPGVTLELMAVPGDWPAGPFDLIMFSEVLCYFGIPRIHEAARRTLESLAPGGTVVLVNWHGSTGGACSEDAAASIFIRDVKVRLGLVRQDRAEKYWMHVLE